MIRIALGLAVLLALPLTACSDDTTEAAPTQKPAATCMDHQKLAVHLTPVRKGLPAIDALIGRSWEKLDGPDSLACATLDMELPPAGWTFVRGTLTLHDWLHVTTLETDQLEGLSRTLQLQAAECVGIEGVIVLARDGKQARWERHTDIGPACKG